VTDVQKESPTEKETAAANDADEIAEVDVAVADEEEKDEDVDADDALRNGFHLRVLGLGLLGFLLNRRLSIDSLLARHAS
jgi:hypothetical protein